MDGLENGVSDQVPEGGAGRHTETKTSDTRRVSPRRPILEEKGGNEQRNLWGRALEDRRALYA